MKTLKRLLTILSLFLLTSCGVNWHVSTLNYDPIYNDENYIVVSDDVAIDTLNEFQFRNKLRTDFQFRYDFAQYALTQPRSFDWNNRLLGNRWNWNRSYWGYGYYSYWNRDQMWNDWVWGFTPYRWSPFGYDRWGYNNWMGNAHWGYSWNNYYGWNGWYNNQWGWRNQMNSYAWQHRNRPNTVLINGRRGSSVNNEVISNRRVNANTRVRANNTRTNTKPRIYVRPENNNNVIIRNNNNNTRTIRVTPTVPVIRNNNTRPSYNNTLPSNNVRPRVNTNNNTRSTSTNVNRSTTSRDGSSTRRQ